MEPWQELYENTYMSTNMIEKKLGLVKDSVRQKARARYDTSYRKARELKVRGWPKDNPLWIELYENTMLTHEEIALKTGMTVKQLFRRIRDAYPEGKRHRRNSLNKTAEFKQTRLSAESERATTIPEGSTAKRLEAVSPRQG